MIFAAKDLGLGADAEMRDRTQMQFLALLVRQGASRFVLKGGMAMRALYASVRLTKDVDFDCENNVSQASMQTQMPKALDRAARLASLTGIDVTQTKKADRSNRWRIRGTTADGTAVNWEVEVSRRGLPPADFIETRIFEAPLDYRIPNFNVRVYGSAAMAGGKVNALLSDNRSVPRDVYDLSLLIRHGADPTPLWLRCVPRETLEGKRDVVMAKIERIDFALANAELLPYLAPSARDGIDAHRWDEIRLTVTEHVEKWINQAIPRARTAKEMHREPDDADFAGR
jgi:predicted nucleotidyltransferase component of viral defense system